MSFAGLTVFFLSIGSTAIYTYTPELHPTEIRTTAMGIASAWGRVGAAGLRTLLCKLGKITGFSGHRPGSLVPTFWFSALAHQLAEGHC